MDLLYIIAHVHPDEPEAEVSAPDGGSAAAGGAEPAGGGPRCRAGERRPGPAGLQPRRPGGGRAAPCAQLLSGARLGRQVGHYPIHRFSYKPLITNYCMCSPVTQELFFNEFY